MTPPRSLNFFHRAAAGYLRSCSGAYGAGGDDDGSSAAEASADEVQAALRDPLRRLQALCFALQAGLDAARFRRCWRAADPQRPRTAT